MHPLQVRIRTLLLLVALSAVVIWAVVEYRVRNVYPSPRVRDALHRKHPGFEVRSMYRATLGDRDVWTFRGWDSRGRFWTTMVAFSGEILWDEHEISTDRPPANRRSD